MIAVSHLGKRYGDLVAVEDFTAAVPAGQQQTLQFARDGDVMDGNYDQGRITRAIQSRAPGPIDAP